MACQRGSLEDAIKALDKMIAEENEDYAELMAQDSAAKEVIPFAKKSEESNDVVAMMDMPEKDAQADYDPFVKESAEERPENSE